jgi:hypothetical protein
LLGGQSLMFHQLVPRHAYRFPGHARAPPPGPLLREEGSSWAG